MNSADEAKVENNEEENKSPDKKQIEAEEKEMMLKSDTEKIEEMKDVANEAQNEGPVKTALSTEFTEEGREVKPKFIPIGGIKMPGFFTRNSDKDKSKDDDADKEGENDDKPKPRHRLQFLHTCPFTQFLHQPPTRATADGENENNAGIRRFMQLPKMNYPKIFKNKSDKDPEAALASMETLEDKLDGQNDGMENVKLDGDQEVEGKVATKLPLKERIRQKKFLMGPSTCNRKIRVRQQACTNALKDANITKDDIVVAALVVLVVLSVIVGVIVASLAGPPAERPLRLGRYMTTLTTCGPVEGILDEGVYKFFNIPYAVPPVGEKRFTNAEPLNSISKCWNGTRTAHEPGPVCIQFLENSKPGGEEDCLTLDVMTPHVRFDSPLAVVILIGANTLAGGIGPLQPPPLYSRIEEVVFVRPNFRLGAFGFLALDMLAKSKYPETSGNYALSDLIAVLEWVQYNIKHFGGDPQSVTLLGHRAGATLVAALTTIKKAQKMYSRVWLSSPSVVFPGKELEDSMRENMALLSRTSCRDVDCLRKASPLEILGATPDTWLQSKAGSLPSKNEIQHSWLVLDGGLLTINAYDSWEAQKKTEGSTRDRVFKPMVFGTTQHSGHTDLLKKLHLEWTPEIVERTVNESLSGLNLTAAEVFQHFNKTYEGLVEFISAVRYVCPLVSLARIRLAVPMYVVQGEGAGFATVDADVQAILGTFQWDNINQRGRYMTAMQRMFYYYVRHGRLPGPDVGLTAVSQDAHPVASLPACDLLIQKDIVPRYARVD